MPTKSPTTKPHLGPFTADRVVALIKPPCPVGVAPHHLAAPVNIGSVILSDFDDVTDLAPLGRARVTLSFCCLSPLLEKAAMWNVIHILKWFSLKHDFAYWFSPGGPSQPGIEPLDGHAEPPGINAQQVKDGGIDLMDVNGFMNHVIAEFVSFAVDYPRFDTTPSHPHGEALGMVIPAVLGLG